MKLRFLYLLIASSVVAGMLQAQSAAERFAGLPVIGAEKGVASDHLSFVVLGDKTSGGEGKWPIYDRAVDAINLLRPEFVITVGDQIPGHMVERAKWDEEWAEYKSHAARLEVPLLVIPGNHDIANLECYRYWKEDLGPTYFSFDYRGCHFLVLNTEEERFDGRGPVWQAMMTFMEKDLAAATGSRHTFVFFHKPMWDDPRYADDWNRLEQALGDRKCTIVAGHEHYLMSERRGNMHLVLQSATGGGIALSEAKAFGAFHSFGYVTVEGDEVTYAVIEPDGGIWPVDVAPAAFRKAVTHEVVRLDAEAAIQRDVASGTVMVHAVARLNNVFDKDIEVELSVKGSEKVGWRLALDPTRPAEHQTLRHVLSPGQTMDVPLPFHVPAGLPVNHPPMVSWRIKVDGAWVSNESMPMVQELCVPLYPQSCMRTVKEWMLAGPFSIGEIDTGKLPDAPKAANPKLYQLFGPEAGYQEGREYEGGVKWMPAESVGRGLLNFNALMGTVDQAVGYALCGIASPMAQSTHVLVYGDNFVQVYLNGTLVDHGESFGAPGGFTFAPLSLREGWNTLVVKLVNNRADWFLRVLVADPMGNLRFARVPAAS